MRFPVFMLCFVVAACSTPTSIEHPTTLPPQPYYTGVILEDEIKVLPEKVSPDAHIIRTVNDVEANWIIDQDDAYTIFQCNRTWYSGGKHSTANEPRICSISADKQFVLAEKTYAAIPSPNKQWIVFASTQEDQLASCNHRLFVIKPDGTSRTNLMPDSTDRICAISDLRWLNDTTISFEGWTGIKNEKTNYRIWFEL